MSDRAEDALRRIGEILREFRDSKAGPMSDAERARKYRERQKEKERPAEVLPPWIMDPKYGNGKRSEYPSQEAAWKGAWEIDQLAIANKKKLKAGTHKVVNGQLVPIGAEPSKEVDAFD